VPPAIALGSVPFGCLASSYPITALYSHLLTRQV